MSDDDTTITCSEDGCDQPASKALHGRAIATEDQDGNVINFDILRLSDRQIQGILENGEGQRTITCACPDHEGIFEEQRAAMADDPLAIPLGMWTRKDDGNGPTATSQ